MTTHKNNRGRALLDELRSPGYIDRARVRARRRRSIWNLLLIPLSIGGIGLSYYFFIQLIFVMRNALLPQHSATLQEFLRGNCEGISTIVFVLGPFFAALPVGFFLCNCVVWIIPPARRAFAKEAKGVSHASFFDAQRDLLLAAKYLVPLCLALSLAGALALRCPR